jgi:hypothetical protein
MIEYPTMGIRPVRNAVATIQGNLVINVNQVDKSNATQWNLYRVLGEFIQLANNATALVQTPLFQTLTTVLLGPGPGHGPGLLGSGS